MGGFLSSQPQQPTAVSEVSEAAVFRQIQREQQLQREEQIIEENRRRAVEAQQRKDAEQRLLQTIKWGQIQERARREKLQQVPSNIIVIKENYELIESVLRHELTSEWAPCNYKVQTVKLAQLNSWDPEYVRVNDLFRRTNKRCFSVTKIERVQNPYLMAAFILKMEELEQRIGDEPQIQMLFHGTKTAHRDSICRNNFDWRLHGQNRGYKFGKGVSFTPISNYATHYGDEAAQNNTMFVVKVLVGLICEGGENMALPPVGYDTTQKKNGHVVVKYEDNEYYPEYIITYSNSGSINPPGRSARSQNRRRDNSRTLALDWSYIEVTSNKQ